MGYLDRIAECNAHDLDGFLPFDIGEAQPGWVRPRFARRLADYPEAFAVDERGVRTAAALASFQDRTETVAAVLRGLSENGELGRWRDEAYPVGSSLFGPHLMSMDRSAIPFFGVRAYGVHVAALAGLPRAVVSRARELLAQLEAAPQGADWGGTGAVSAAAAPESTDGQLALLAAPPDALSEELARLEPDELSPLEALQRLYELRAAARARLGVEG